MEFVVIFAVVATGSLVCISAGLMLKFLARKEQGQTLAMGPGRSSSPHHAAPRVDPVLNVGFILSCYGPIALALIVALPGALALERTVLAFALLCVGGLIAEISHTGNDASGSMVDPDEDATPMPSKPVSKGLSLALMLVLNGAVGALTCGQGLIAIVPPASVANAGRGQEFDPIVVVAQRTHDPLLTSSL